MLQVGCAEIVARVVEDLKDESEPYRRMVMETTEKVIRDLGTAEIDARLEELLIDGILYAFQEQVSRYAAWPAYLGCMQQGMEGAGGQGHQCTALAWRRVASQCFLRALALSCKAWVGVFAVSLSLQVGTATLRLYVGPAESTASDALELCSSYQAARPDHPIVVVQASDDANVMLNGFGTVVNSLKHRAKPYLPQICGTIKWRLNNKNAKIRQQAADLIARIAVVMKVRRCGVSWVLICSAHIYQRQLCFIYS